MNARPLWTPGEDRIRNARMTEFMRFAGERSGVEFSDYSELWRWSIDRRDQFWQFLWEYTEVVSSRRWDDVLQNGDAMPGATWFSGARLNFAENLLRYRDGRAAIVFWNEHGRQRTISYDELHREVARVAGWLRATGVGVGDRVAAYLPNMPETVIVMLATASVGATFSSCSPDFGVEGVTDRFGQIEPKILFTVDGYTYAGKTHDCLSRAATILERIPSIQKTVVVSYLGKQEGWSTTSRAAGDADRFDDFAEIGDASDTLVFEQLPFDHPLYILFSSGTTGVPKCIVHGAGGTLLQHLKEHQLHTDIRRDDRLFYFTTCGWMMWNWLVSGLASGCSIVLYDGSPFHPAPAALFDLAESESVTVFGVSAKYLSAVEKAGVKPRETHDLSSVGAILSTGSPLAPASFDFVYEQVKPDVCLSSISGGTDIVSCFVLGNPIAPVWRGELQSPGLGMAVDVFDEDGRPLRGEKGELVCTRPFPSMPVGFWNDPGGRKYRRAYFERFPQVWHHGDFAEITPHGGFIIFGRSDAVLNPGGVRIGTAEIYRQVEQIPDVLECLAVGQQWEGDERIVLFVRMREQASLDDELQDQIRRRIRAGATPRHVPAKIIAVDDIPRTKSGKIVEVAVREMVHGREVQNRNALANPESLEFFRSIPELAE